MSIKTTRPVENAAKLGGQGPGYYLNKTALRLVLTSNVSLAGLTTSDVKILWNTISERVGNIATYNSEVVIKEAGFYIVSFTAVTATETPVLKIYKNNFDRSNFLAATPMYQCGGFGGGTACAVAYLVAEDRLICYMRDKSTSTTTLYVANSFFTVAKVG